MPGMCSFTRSHNISTVWIHMPPSATGNALQDDWLLRLSQHYDSECWTTYSLANCVRIVNPLHFHSPVPTTPYEPSPLVSACYDPVCPLAWQQTDWFQPITGREGGTENQWEGLLAGVPANVKSTWICMWCHQVVLWKEVWVLIYDAVSPGPPEQLSNSAESAIESNCTQTTEDDASNFMSCYYPVFLTAW